MPKIKTKPAPQDTRQIGFSTFTLADKTASAKTQQVIIDLAVKTKQLTAKDTQTWRTAWQIAINVDNPKRNRLIDVYTDVMIDPHLAGSIRNRQNMTLAKSFKVINTTNMTENEDLTRLLETPWFKQFVRHALDSVFWGYSLIEFGSLITDPILMFDGVKLVPREHVIPEYSRVIKDAMDEWKKGLDFSQPPLSAWCLGIGDIKDLGLLLNVSPQAISKKNMMAYWDQFGEIFGMPLRIGKSSSRDPKERTKVETMLSSMGAASWGLFPEGTDIEIKETTRGDAYNVYDMRIERCNTEMSKLILGVTMTMDNGSSMSQSEVHERQLQFISSTDADMVRDIVNTRLFPFLKQHGFNFDGHRFDWDESIEYTPEQQLAIDTLMLANYMVDPKYFADKYNVPITGEKNAQQSAGFFD
ncbi:MAG: DUF935 family protein [Bacteroidetes bacterium]|nr:DUF935 family protein [Bacteroidota bacterium]